MCSRRGRRPPTNLQNLVDLYPFTTLISSLIPCSGLFVVVVREKVGDAAPEGAAGAQLSSIDPLHLPFQPPWWHAVLARAGFPCRTCPPALSRIKFDTNAQVATAGAGGSTDPADGDGGDSGDQPGQADESDDELADDEYCSDLLEEDVSSSEVDWRRRS
jgi:hypothetical protein